MPSVLWPCGKTAFLGAFGPAGCNSVSSGVVPSAEAGERGDWSAPILFPLPGDEENLEDMLESQEFRRDVTGDEDFERLPPVAALSVPVEILGNPDRWGIGLAAAGTGSFGCAVSLVFGAVDTGLARGPSFDMEFARWAFVARGLSR